MAGYICIGALAAFGLTCALWILWGIMYHRREEGILLYTGQDVLTAARHYLWLREMGLVYCPLLVLAEETQDSRWLTDQGIEIVCPGELTRRLGLE